MAEEYRLPKVSVIMAAYNTAKYIKKAINSVISQDYQNVELIIVDDGSTDSTGAVCDIYAKAHDNIKVIHVPNGGQARARNIGIKHSTGEYFVAVDSDDFIHRDFISTLVSEALRADADISVVSYFEYHSAKSVVARAGKPKSAIYTNIDAMRDHFLEGSVLEPALCNKLIKKSLLVDHNLWFPEGDIYEDSRNLYRLYYYANRVVFNGSPLYYYRQRSGSVMNSSISMRNYHLLMGIPLEAKAWVDDNVSESLDDELAAYYVTGVINSVNYMVDRKIAMPVQYDYLRSTLRPQVRTLLNNPYISRKRKLLIPIIATSLRPYSVIREFYLAKSTRRAQKTSGSLRLKSGIIMTMPLGPNYGGIMQAFALQTALRALGAQVFTSTPQVRPSSVRQLLSRLKTTVRRSDAMTYDDTYGIIAQHTKKFVTRYIATLSYEDALLRINSGGSSSDAGFVVFGSDQVWRARYGYAAEYMGSDIKNDKVRLLSYAASFGVESAAEFSSSDSQRTSKLLKRFKAISTREASGVAMLRDKWGMSAVQHVDPTLLIEKDQYVSLIREDDSPLMEFSGDVFAYVLDNEAGKSNIIDKVSSILGKTSFDVLPQSPPSRKELLLNRDKYILPRVTQWIKGFESASFVVTDSFHGVVFSIIFNKPFIAIGNKERGLARFTSLLQLFKLEDRLVLNVDEVTNELVHKDINWEKVNAITRRERKRSLEYLKENLG